MWASMNSRYLYSYCLPSLSSGFCFSLPFFETRGTFAKGDFERRCYISHHPSKESSSADAACDLWATDTTRHKNVSHSAAPDNNGVHEGYCRHRAAATRSTAHPPPSNGYDKTSVRSKRTAVDKRRDRIRFQRRWSAVSLLHRCLVLLTRKRSSHTYTLFDSD